MFSFQGAFWVSSSRNSMKSHFHGTSVNSLTVNCQFSTVNFCWWRVPGSNRWPPACKAGALPAELTPRLGTVSSFSEVVGQNGLEPSTSRLSVVCSSQLSYWPILSSLLNVFPHFRAVPSKLNNVKYLSLCTDLRTLLKNALLLQKSP